MNDTEGLLTLPLSSRTTSCSTTHLKASVPSGLSRCAPPPPSPVLPKILKIYLSRTSTLPLVHEALFLSNNPFKI
jgi:hypothetical protein